MANSAPTQRRVPVGYRFRPTEKELVAHYLRRKLMADDPSVHDTIPEIDVCKHEPWDILAALATKFDDSECFFFSPYSYKYRNSMRRNRATLCGLWKVTGSERKVTDHDTNNVIGMKRTLVFDQKHVSKKCKTNWIIHEYHDLILPSHKRTHALCWLRKKHEKKTKEKTYHSIDDKGESNNMIFDYENHTNICMTSGEQCLSNTSLNIQTPSQSNEVISSLAQTPSQSNEIIDSMIQMPSQSNEVIDSQIQTRFQSNDVMNSMIQIPSQSIESESIDSMIQTLFESDETINSMIHALLMSNYTVETPFDA